MIISWPILDGFGKSGYGVKAEKEDNLWKLVSILNIKLKHRNSEGKAGSKMKEVGSRKQEERRSDQNASQVIPN